MITNSFDSQTVIHLLWVCTLFSLTGCPGPSSDISDAITRHFQSSGRTFVNLAEVTNIPWDRVCILGPYSDNNSTEATLGFEWDSERLTSIMTNDGIALLLFVKGQNVIEFVEHSRISGDFANLSRQCFPREKSMFSHQSNPKKGWPGLFPKE